MVPHLQSGCWQLDSPKTLRNRREVALDAAGSDVSGYLALAIFIGKAGKHRDVAVGDLRFAEKARNERHGLVARCQSLKLAGLRGVHYGNPEPFRQFTGSLTEEVSKLGLSVRKLRRHGMWQIPPARSADDEIHFPKETARRPGTNLFQADDRAHGTGGSGEHPVV